MHSPSPATGNRFRAAQRLLVLLVAVLVVLAGTTVGASASMTTRPGPSSGLAVASVAETRVGVADISTPVFVGLGGHVPADHVGKTCPRFLSNVSASCVATNGLASVQSSATSFVRTFQYNANGSLVRDGLRNLTYNVAGDLVNVSEPTGTVSYTTDGNGNRSTETTSAGTTTFRWDEVGPYPMLAMETNGADAKRYTYGLELIAAKTPTTTNYFHPDAIGSTTAITSTTGATSATYNYDAFGKVRNSTINDPTLTNNPILFAGERLDRNTGYYNLRARLYDPALGRFNTTDPLRRPIGDPSFSPYTYAANRPGTLTDPTGQREAIANGAWDWTSAIGGGVKDGVIGVLKTPGAFIQATRDFPTNLRNLPEGIVEACRSTRTLNGALGGVQCGVGVVFTGTGMRAFTEATMSCLDSISGTSGNEFRCMVRQGVAAVTQAYATAKIIETVRPKTAPCRNSFVAETLVLMADGSTKRIDQVEVGDMVMATDAETGKTVAHEVLDLISDEGEKHLVDVKIRTKDGVRTILATRGHPFWVDDQGSFLRADQLRSGDDLRTPEGGEVEVVSIRQHTEWIKVHNLTVEGVHTYYVLAGNEPVLVHNQSSGIDVKASGKLVQGDFPRTAGPGEVLYRVDAAGNVTNYQVYGASGNPQMRVDVVGRAHGGIETPHVQEFNENVNPATGETYVNKGAVRAAEPGEIPC